MLLQLPVGSFLAVEDFARKADIFLQPVRDFPLRIVWFWRRHRNPMARRHFACVPEDRLSPPLQLPILCWRETANEGALLKFCKRVYHMKSMTDLERQYSLAHQRASSQKPRTLCRSA